MSKEASGFLQLINNCLWKPEVDTYHSFPKLLLCLKINYFHYAHLFPLSSLPLITEQDTNEHIPNQLLNQFAHLKRRSKKILEFSFKNDELNNFLISRKKIYTILVVIYINHMKSKFDISHAFPFFQFWFLRAKLIIFRRK